MVHPCARGDGTELTAPGSLCPSHRPTRHPFRIPALLLLPCSCHPMRLPFLFLIYLASSVNVLIMCDLFTTVSPKANKLGTQKYLLAKTKK